MRYLWQTIGNLLAILLAATFIPGVTSSSYTAILWAAVVLTLLNVFLRPILLLIILPLNLITMGVFSVLITTWMVMLMDKIIKGIAMGGFVNALVTALLVMIALNIVHRWQDKAILKRASDC